MRALTLWQPWASAITHGLKTVETRSWRTDYRGPLAIHAAQRSPRALEWPDGLLEVMHGHFNWTAVPLGRVVCVCELVDVVSTEEFGLAVEERPLKLLHEVIEGAQMEAWDLERELIWGNFEPGRYAWLLGSIERISRPFRVKGARGLWEMEPADARLAANAKRAT